MKILKILVSKRNDIEISLKPTGIELQANPIVV